MASCVVVQFYPRKSGIQRSDVMHNSFKPNSTNGDEERVGTQIENRQATEASNRDNLLLAALPSAERKRLQQFLKRLDLQLSETLIEPGRAIKGIYFPITMVTSTVQELSDGAIVESGLMGAEGMIGIQFWLHQKTTPSRTLVQVAGSAYFMSAEVFKREVMDKDSPLNRLVASYIHAFLNMTGQTAACNRLHEVETRLARWLTLVYDRVRRPNFAMRQEFLAQMLGVHRPAVTIAANTLQKAGLISYRRGQMTIENPQGLRLAACECLELIEAQFDQLFGPTWRPRDA
jgi:CRP-like cAMP-binding protein